MMYFRIPHQFHVQIMLLSLCLLWLLADIPAATADLALLQIPAKSDSKKPVEQTQPVCRLKLRLVESQQGQERIVPGLLRVLDQAGQNIPLPELLNRGTGIKRTPESESTGIHSWSVIPREMEISVPQTKITLEAISGLETELSRLTVDLSQQSAREITIKLKPFSQLSSLYQSANTHLHLMKLDRQECDNYLIQVPSADRLDLVFISHLERAIADKTYITNRYTKADLDALSQKSGVKFGWGEEHRHNSTGYDEGYGHVMLLDIQKLIQPVSIGPGIMKQGTDGIPLSRGINTATRDQATVIWCHNAWGLEATPNIVQGKVHAVNIFDGGTRSSFKDSYYQYLNAGFKTPFSTGTDWFQYDFSRVYARQAGPVTTATWLNSLRAGRTFITNGPLLDLRVNDQVPGDQLKLTAAQNQIHIQATGRGRVDFQKLELVQNGNVIMTQPTTAVGGHFEARIDQSINIHGPGWIALRTPSPSVPPDPQRQQKTPLNELGRELFSHTSPVYLEWEGQILRNRKQSQAFLTEMTQNREKIAKQFLFADEQERAQVLDVYTDAIEILTKQLNSD